MRDNQKAPQIRFSGFEKEYEKKQFDSVFDFISNNTLSRDNLNYHGGSTQNVHYGDILTKFGEYIDAEKEILPFLNDEEVALKYQNATLKDGDIIIADTAEDAMVGKCSEIGNIGDKKIISGLHTIPCRTKVKYASKYMGYYLNSEAYHHKLLPLMQGVKVIAISKSGIQGTELCLSQDYDEQKKIGEFFFAIDEKIKYEKQKLDAIKMLKKSMLTKMFPREGQSKPEIRFAGFNEAWEQRKLEDFGIATGGTSIESEFSEDGKYKVISIGSYSENSVYNDQGIRAVESEKTLKRVLNKGDLTMILNDKTASGNIIGRALLIEESGVYVYNQRTERIEINDEEYDSLFIYEMLNAPNIREKIIKQAQGNTQIYVNWSVIALTEYLIPKKEEQIRIGQYFSNLDNLITLHQRELEKLENVKSACMKSMFV